MGPQQLHSLIEALRLGQIMTPVAEVAEIDRLGGGHPLLHCPARRQVSFATDGFAFRCLPEHQPHDRRMDAEGQSLLVPRRPPEPTDERAGEKTPKGPASFGRRSLWLGHREHEIPIRRAPEDGQTDQPAPLALS